MCTFHSVLTLLLQTGLGHVNSIFSLSGKTNFPEVNALNYHD